MPYLWEEILLAVKNISLSKSRTIKLSWKSMLNDDSKIKSLLCKKFSTWKINGLQISIWTISKWLKIMFNYLYKKNLYLLYFLFYGNTNFLFVKFLHSVSLKIIQLFIWYWGYRLLSYWNKSSSRVSWNSTSSNSIIRTI